MKQTSIRAIGSISETSGRKVLGLIPYNSESLPIYDFDGQGYIESIDRGAFTKTLQESRNIRALYHHDNGSLLASTKNNSLKLEDTNEGLRFEFELPETTLGNDVLEMIRSGLVDGVSFGARVIKDRWEGAKRRFLKEVALHEISLCPQDQAYPGSICAVRALSEAYEGQELTEEQKSEIQAEIAKLNDLICSQLINNEDANKVETPEDTAEVNADEAVVDSEETPVVVEEPATPEEPTVNYEELYNTLKAEKEANEAEWDKILTELEGSFNTLKGELHV